MTYNYFHIARITKVSMTFCDWSLPCSGRAEALSWCHNTLMTRVLALIAQIVVLRSWRGPGNCRSILKKVRMKVRRAVTIKIPWQSTEVDVHHHGTLTSRVAVMKETRMFWKSCRDAFLWEHSCRGEEQFVRALKSKEVLFCKNIKIVVSCQYVRAFTSWRSTNLFENFRQDCPDAADHIPKSQPPCVFGCLDDAYHADEFPSTIYIDVPWWSPPYSWFWMILRVTSDRFSTSYPQFFIISPTAPPLLDRRGHQDHTWHSSNTVCIKQDWYKADGSHCSISSSDQHPCSS